MIRSQGDIAGIIAVGVFLIFVQYASGPVALGMALIAFAVGLSIPKDTEQPKRH